MAETYKQARARLHKELGELGWKTSKPELKQPWALSSCQQWRLEFHPQAVYLNGHSMFIDMRGLSVFELQRLVSK